jgi:hypothetical protein
MACTFDAWARRYEGDFALEFELEDGANRSTQGASGQGASMAALALDETRGLRSWFEAFQAIAQRAESSSRL